MQDQREREGHERFGVWLSARQHAPQVPLAHREPVRDRLDVRAAQELCARDRELRMRVGRARMRDALGDRALQDGCGCRGVRCLCEAVAKAMRRRAAPELFDVDDAACDLGGRHTQHCDVRAEVNARHHAALAAAKQLAMRLLPDTERVHVEPAFYARAEANDQVRFGSRNGDALHIAIELVHDQRGYGRRDLPWLMMLIRGRKHAGTMWLPGSFRKIDAGWPFLPMSGCAQELCLYT